MVGWNPKKLDPQIQLPDVIKNPSGRDVADVHHHVDDGERDRALLGGRINPRRRQEHRRPERFADRERKHAANQRQRGNRGHDHDAAGEGANRDAEEKSPAQTDRVGERAGEQGEHGHGRRPDPADQCPGRLIAEAEVLREPQDHRLVRDRVGGVDEELDQEREPQLASRASQHTRTWPGSRPGPSSPAEDRPRPRPRFLLSSESPRKRISRIRSNGRAISQVSARRIRSPGERQTTLPKRESSALFKAFAR